MKHFLIHSAECAGYCLFFHLIDAKFAVTEQLIHFLSHLGLW